MTGHPVARCVLALALSIAACSSPGSAGGTPKAAVSTRPSASTPVGLPAGIATTLPAPLPSPGGYLTLPAFPGTAFFEGVADTRGTGSLDLTIGRSGPGSPYFAPTVIEGTTGQSLQLHISNTTPVTHNFTIREESLNADIGVGSAVDVVVTFPRHGALVFFCRFHGEVDGHAGELFTVPS